VHRAIERADLIINVGHDVVEKPPFFMHHNDKKVIHVNFDSAAVDPVYFPQLEVVGDIANSIWQIKEGITPQDDWKLDFYKDVHQAYVEHRAEAEDDNRFPILPERLVRDIRKVMPDNGIVTLDNGIYKIWFARNYPAFHPNTLLLDNALASMGAGLPSAIAAKLVNPQAPVLSVCGDGGFMMNSQEIETAVRLNLDLVVIILRDDAYGMIKWKQANMQFDEFGLDYGNPNFVKYAQSYGAQGWRVDDTDVLIHMVDKCLNTKGVHIIDCPVDYSMNDETLNHTIKELSAKL
jgi:acetolactate synthase-1/2/3 large subunit